MSKFLVAALAALALGLLAGPARAQLGDNESLAGDPVPALVAPVADDLARAAVATAQIAAIAGESVLAVALAAEVALGELGLGRPPHGPAPRAPSVVSAPVPGSSCE